MFARKCLSSVRRLFTQFAQMKVVNKSDPLFEMQDG